MIKPCKMSGKPSASHGIALILVLWMLVLATIMAASFTLTMRRELSIVSNARDLAEASALTEAGITYAMQMLMVPDQEIQWQANGQVYEIEFAGSAIRLKIINESGKININNPDKRLLRGAIRKAGLEEEQQDAIIDSILDWQDADDSIHENGAEIDEYEQEGRKYGPANQPFQVLEELQLVLGVSADLFKQLESILTVHSFDNKINPAFAQKEVLMTLPDVDEVLIDQFIQEREAYAKDPTLETPEFPYPENASNGSSQVYTLIAEAQLDNGHTGKTRAVIAKINSVNGLPYTILEWHTAPANEKSLF